MWQNWWCIPLGTGFRSTAQARFPIPFKTVNDLKGANLFFTCTHLVRHVSHIYTISDLNGAHAALFQPCRCLKKVVKKREMVNYPNMSGSGFVTEASVGWTSKVISGAWAAEANAVLSPTLGTSITPTFLSTFKMFSHCCVIDLTPANI